MDNHIAFNCDEETNFLTNHTYYNELDNSIEENIVQVTYMTVEEVEYDDTNNDDDDDDDDTDDDTNENDIYHDYNDNDSDNDEDEDSVS